MSQQALDLRRSMQLARQHKVLMATFIVLGILGGAAYAYLKPPMVSSTALVALPTSGSVQLAPTAGGASGTSSGTDPFTSTQEVVADSYRVLLHALPALHPAMSITELRRDVQVSSPSADIISVTAKAKNAASAEATANAVAASYINYVRSSGSAVGRVQAHLLAPASTATVPSRAEHLIVFALLGGLAGALIGFIVALAIGRNDRRLRQRDEIASSIGVPVIASLPVAHPSNAAGWRKLLEEYKPTAAQAWQLLTALDQVGVPRSGFGSRASDDHRDSLYDDHAPGYDGRAFSVTIVSLSADSGALALGPHLAGFAASRGIPTSLVIGTQNPSGAGASLRVACAPSSPLGAMRHGLLRVANYDDGGPDLLMNTALVIVVAVVDSRVPEMPSAIRTNATVIGVSAGGATAEQLARAAVATTADGSDISGILVADPLDEDQTTGRIPRLPRSAGSRLPNRLRGIGTEVRR
jgi:capsular polysaccharide biosynthesis protein